DFRVLPSIPVTVGAVDYVELQQPGAAKFLRLFREGKYLGRLGQGLVSTQISSANITIRLYDANSGGKAQQVASYLERAGFVVLPVAPAPAGMSKTELLYGPTERKPEGVVSSYLPRVPPAFAASGTPGVNVVVVIGPDFKGIG
ncbi:MAG TPA: LytR C-terminal domain-containing protein, partial [Actinomycetota bacterium]|nr:LytR C-terminal domain-containing protein [Actinomycetota bacterium]